MTIVPQKCFHDAHDSNNNSQEFTANYFMFVYKVSTTRD